MLVCPEVIHEIEPSRRLIFDPLAEDVKANVRLKDSFWLPDEAFSFYARAATIVSMEVHSVILALAAGTPVLHPTFFEAGRKRHMLNDLGLGNWLFDIDKEPADTIGRALFAIHSGYDAALAKVKAAMTIVEKHQHDTMNVLKRTLAQIARRGQS